MGGGGLYTETAQKLRNHIKHKNIWPSFLVISKSFALHAVCFLLHACTSQHWPFILIPAMVAATCHAKNILVSSLGGLIVIALYTIL